MQNGQCCFDYGNSENTALQPVHTGDYACGAMEAIYFGNAHWQGNTGAGKTGPWVGADLEAGMFYGGGNETKVNPTNKPLTTDFVSLHLKGYCTSTLLSCHFVVQFYGQIPVNF